MDKKAGDSHKNGGVGKKKKAKNPNPPAASALRIHNTQGGH